MQNSLLKHHKLVLAFIIFLSFYAALGYVPLFDLDEGAFSEATREMLKSHNYITTYLNGDLRFDKPILIYWLQAFSVKLFDLNEFALRLPSAIASTFWAMAIYSFTKRHFDGKTAFLATLFMAGSLQITVIAKAAIADALLNMFIALSLFYLYDYLKSGKKSYLYLASAAVAFGTLTKGPVAIMVPFVTLFIYLAIKREFALFFKTVFNPIVIAIFLIIAAPWYTLEYLDQGQKFINGFFLKHNLSRFEGSLEGHSGSLFYYIPVILIGMLPFTTALLKMLTKVKSYFKSDLELYLLIWGAFVFIFFSFSGTKLPHYIIYGYTPFFILMALSFKDIKSQLALHFPTILLFIILLLLPFIAPIIAPSVHDKVAKILLPFVPDSFGITYKLYFASGILILIYLAFNKQLDKINQIVVASVLLLIGVNFFAAPSYAKLAQQPIKEAGLLAKKENLKVVMYGINTPTFNVYAQRLVAKRKPKVGEVAFVKVTTLKEFKKYTTLYKKYGYALIKVEK